MSDYAAGVRRGGPGLAVWGMAMLVASEATLFGTFIGSYYYLRFGAQHWPPPGTPEPRVVVPLILAGVLGGATIGITARHERAGTLRASVPLAEPNS